MRHTILVTVDEKGGRKIVHGPEVAERKQRESFQKFKHGELPKGVCRVEVWQRIKQTTGVDLAARKLRIDEEAKAEEARASQGEGAASEPGDEQEKKES